MDFSKTHKVLECILGEEGQEKDIGELEEEKTTNSVF
jgi:hypothetical protein